MASRIGNEVAKRESAQAPAKLTPAQIVTNAINNQAGRFTAVLPEHFNATRFTNLVLTAVKSKPQLMECFNTEAGKMSLLLAAMLAAEVGIEPDTPLQEGWLLPRRNGQRMECQLSIGYQGLIKLARQSGEIKSITAQVVHENDDFDYGFGLEGDTFHHKPAHGPRGELTHAYAIARYKDGGYNFVVLDQADVERRRAKSDSWKGEKSRAYSPWTTSTEAMWRKSAIRELAKWMPKSALMVKAMGNEERTLTFDDDGTIIAIPEAEIIETGEAAGELEPAADTPDSAEPIDVAEVPS